MKKARSVDHKMINCSQNNQTCQYAEKAKDPAIQKGDIASMLKVETRFKLDRAFRGPYRVQSTTQTNINAIVRPVSDPTVEEVYVSLQRLSKCHNGHLDVTPWMHMGHGNEDG